MDYDHTLAALIKRNRQLLAKAAEVRRAARDAKFRAYDIWHAAAMVRLRSTLSRNRFHDGMKSLWLDDGGQQD